MAGLVGVLDLDASPLDRRTLESMLGRLRHRGRNESAEVVGPVGLGVIESRLVKRGGLLLAFHGRLDAGEGFDLATERAARSGDGDRVLDEYERGGDEALTKLVGDFALALWDGSRRRLVCLRDPLGVKPLYYYADARVLVFGSELGPVLSHPAVPRRPNEARVAEYLAARHVSETETFYEKVHRLTPGHLLVATGPGLTIRPGWQPPLTDSEPSRDWPDRLRQVLASAIRSRLRGRSQVALALSGGLDSSSILCLARRLGTAERAPVTLEAFSLVFPGLACDETAYIEDVERTCGLRSHRQTCEAEPYDYDAEIDRHLEPPEPPNCDQMQAPLHRAVATRGIPTLVGGLGGDQWLTGRAVCQADLLASRRVLTLLRFLRANLRDRGMVRTMQDFVHGGLGPLAPEALRSAVRPFRGSIAPPWLGPSLRHRTSPGWRPPSGAPALRGTYSQHAMLGVIRSGLERYYLELAERGAARFGLEVTFPFYDRRLVELALLIPETEKVIGALTKVVLRKALGDDLPSSIRTRRTKAFFNHLFGERLRDLHPSGPLLSAREGWVNEQVVEEMYAPLASRHASDRPEWSRHSWPLWNILGTERWLRRLR